MEKPTAYTLRVCNNDEANHLHSRERLEAALNALVLAVRFPQGEKLPFGNYVLRVHKITSAGPDCAEYSQILVLNSVYIGKYRVRFQLSPAKEDTFCGFLETPESAIRKGLEEGLTEGAKKLTGRKWEIAVSTKTNEATKDVVVNAPLVINCALPKEVTLPERIDTPKNQPSKLTQVEVNSKPQTEAKEAVIVKKIAAAMKVPPKSEHEKALAALKRQVKERQTELNDAAKAIEEEERGLEALTLQIEALSEEATLQKKRRLFQKSRLAKMTEPD